MSSTGKQLESAYKEMERAIQRLWENINVTKHSCVVASQEARGNSQPNIFQFENILSSASKLMTRVETLNSLKDIQDRHACKWCIIVAISIFDAWLEDIVDLLHAQFPSLRGESCLRGYRSNMPSFSTDFFSKDQSAIGLAFPQSSPNVKKFVRWKEARNCLVHKGGRITPRYAKCCQPPPKGRMLAPTWIDAKDALAAILVLGKEIRRQLRKQVQRHQKNALAHPRGP